MIKKWFQTENNITATIARIALGVAIFPHGAQKLLGLFGGHGFSGTMGYFTETVGLPWIIAFLVIVTEFLGGIMLIVGVASRFAALAVGSLMIGAAIVGGHINNGFFMNWGGKQTGEGFEYHILAVALAAIIVFSGGGTCSIDKKLSAPKVA